ncbi:Lactoylglutathione lyase [Dinochytrium kinnereticum]|nr:Lactoylglutathione lyase [Dinochytrium kinnereticum]
MMAEQYRPVFNHTMVRVRDPVKSREFYEGILGMKHITSFDFPAAKFTLHFLAFSVPENILTASTEEKAKYVFSTPGVLELTHNWGTESDPEFAGYSSGNSEPGKGFGHIGISVDDVNGFCEYLESKSVPFKKRLSDGSMNNIAFALDPDGYWVEILPKGLKI